MAQAPSHLLASGAGWRQLGSGSSGSYGWSALVRSGSGRECLRVAIEERRGPIAYDRTRFRRCAPTPLRSEAPLIAGGVELGRAGSGLTVLAMAFGRDVVAIRAVLSDGDRAQVALREPPDAGGGQLYGVLAVPARPCVLRLTAVDRRGRAVWQGAPGDCPGSPGAAASTVSLVGQPAKRGGPLSPQA
jgi:hypothetical protein